MARELTHFLIADQVCAHLENNTFWQPFLNNRNCIMLGTIFHDAIFYLLKSCGNPNIKKFPEMLHGSNGEDTYILVKNILTTIQQSKDKEPLVSLLIGIITHIFTDSLFHPMVYFFAGNPHTLDKLRRSKVFQTHRKIEVLMDIYFCGGIEYVGSRPIVSYLREIEVKQGNLFREATRGFFSQDEMNEVVEAFISAYKTYSIIQFFCTNKISRQFFSLLNTVLPVKLRKHPSLVYSPKLIPYLPKISGNISYQNPFSGEENSITLKSLFEQAVEKSIDFCMTTEKILKEEISLDALPVGPSMKLGIPGAKEKDMKYFSEEKFFG